MSRVLPPCKFAVNIFCFCIIFVSARLFCCCCHFVCPKQFDNLLQWPTILRGSQLPVVRRETRSWLWSTALAKWNWIMALTKLPKKICTNYETEIIMKTCSRGTWRERRRALQNLKPSTNFESHCSSSWKWWQMKMDWSYLVCTSKLKYILVVSVSN